MADANLQLVREFFELNMFRVLTNWQHDDRKGRLGEHEPQLFVENINPNAGPAADFVLRPADVSAIERAVVEVRAWHGDRFYPSIIESSPILWQFVEEDALTLAREVFGGQLFATILVISELPTTLHYRNKAIQLLQDAGIDHALEFRALLQDLLNKVSVNATYGSSQTLQTLRLLKRYRLIRHQQMEFSFPTEPPPLAHPAPVETSDETPE